MKQENIRTIGEIVTTIVAIGAIATLSYFGQTPEAVIYSLTGLGGYNIYKQKKQA